MNADNRISIGWVALLVLLVGPMCYAQTATINWANTHQEIDGFGGNDIGQFPIGYTMSAAQAAELFGTSGTELGLSVLRTQVTNGNDSTSDQGSCTSVSASCEGTLLQDLVYANSYGVRIVANQDGFPSAYTSNGSVTCTSGSGNGTLLPSHYQDMANWDANFIQSLNSYSGINVYAINADSEPEYCSSSYDNGVMSDSALDTYIKNYLGPTLASNSLAPIVFYPDTGLYSNMMSFPSCATDSACASYLGAISFHDYGATESGGPGPNTVTPEPYPAGWASGKKYWVLEGSCRGNGTMPNWCQPGFDPGWVSNALYWAADIDQKLAVDNVGLLNPDWWFVIDSSSASTFGGYALIESSTLRSGDVVGVAGRAYVLAQYARWVRPGYYRIDATHVPQPGISVSAYRDAPSGHLVVVATNYTGAPVAQTFSLTNAPAFSSVVPYVSSSTQDLQQQSAQSVSGNSFSFTLPADSVTTFVGASSTSAGPTAPTNLQATVN